MLVLNSELQVQKLFAQISTWIYGFTYYEPSRTHIIPFFYFPCKHLGHVIHVQSVSFPCICICMGFESGIHDKVTPTVMKAEAVGCSCKHFINRSKGVFHKECS